MAKDDAPRPTGAALPPRARSAATALKKTAFLLEDEWVDAYHVRRNDTLVITFDNLASVGEYDPPQPWMHRRLERAGVSVLGLIAKRKDWYRNPSAPRLLTGLREAGFFDPFARIVMTGTSMGGFAALTFAGLVPRAEVLAFSPQSTLNRDIAPFEDRYPYGQRKWDWQTPDFLDAAEAVPRAAHVWLVYDPYVPEDRAHALRLDGPNVSHVRVGHFGHRAIRGLKELGLLDGLVEGVVAGNMDWPAFWADLRQARRANRGWLKRMLRAAEARHPALARAAAARVVEIFPRNAVARAILAGPEAAPAPAPEAAPAPVPVAADAGEPDPGPPSGGPLFTGSLREVANATLIPERKGAEKLACGVLDAEGRFVEESRSWIRTRRHTLMPRLSPGETVGHLPGRHVFAGHLRDHFGHFLVETTARLWALDQLEDRVESVVFLPYQGNVKGAHRAIRTHTPFFRLLGIEVPIVTYGTPMTVETLYVPELGFGWAERYAGSAAYRHYMRERLSAAVAPEGGEKLYVSRARLNPLRGGVLAERVLEENLARAGFDVFHPEKHPIEVQIARYRAAREIVALDGSALHLAAFVMTPGGKLAMILRRTGPNYASYVTQYESFCGITPGIVDALVTDWVEPDIARSDYRSVGELDFAKVFARLAELGMLPGGFRPDLPPRAALMEELAGFSEGRGAPLIPLAEAEARMRAAE